MLMTSVCNMKQVLFILALLWPTMAYTHELGESVMVDLSKFENVQCRSNVSIIYGIIKVYGENNYYEVFLDCTVDSEEVKHLRFMCSEQDLVPVYKHNSKESIEDSNNVETNLINNTNK
jgi:hypothetical protein